ncbi:acyl-CoA:lysophosphatidylglycerol acyltransferase 1-like [Dreissena polymorpha]|uniref:acyl-CoA:lysophosphatidylglycerol acyltransferase 1-like n=1 Tax=Dreissena polymorpha TaxID=45954 RepID=UPI0022644A0F|nr:acyl-CoA:lysophosphatidylglycerol acyltransferase 1-like [Dreissena polymorpha]
MAGFKQLLYYTFRVLHMIVNNIMAIPAFTVWIILLSPLRKLQPSLYWQIERILFKAILSFVVMWTNSGGYKIIESGDDLATLHDKRVLLLVNHQSTADIPCVMSALLPKSNVIGQIMWIMDYILIYTNFGWVAFLHGDFFIQQGKEYRDSQLDLLKRHLLDVYLPTDKRWIVLFPEGGFLYKRRPRSQAFAEKNGHPVLNNVALPRIGAMNTIIDTLSGPAQKSADEPSRKLEWVVDMTLGYPKGEALDMPGICIGWWSPRNIHIHYRAYPIADIPVTCDAQQQWLYDRYTEKEALLEHFYLHHEFPDMSLQEKRNLPMMNQREVPFDRVWFLIAYAFYAVSAYVFWIYIYYPMWSLISSLVSYIF